MERLSMLMDGDLLKLLWSALLALAIVISLSSQYHCRCCLYSIGPSWYHSLAIVPCEIKESTRYWVGSVHGDRDCRTLSTEGPDNDACNSLLLTDHRWACRLIAAKTLINRDNFNALVASCPTGSSGDCQMSQ